MVEEKLIGEDQKIPFQVSMEDVQRTLADKEMLILQLRVVQRTLEQKLNEALEQNKMLQADIEKLQQKSKLRRMK